MGLLVLWTASAQAQTAPAAQDKAAMERAQREADGPRRRILEAARLKTTVRAPEVQPQPPVAAPALTPATAQRAAPRSDNAESEGVMAVLSPAAPPLQLQSASFAISGITKVAPVALAAPAPPMINVPSRPSAAQLADLPPPRLVSRVDPELPHYLTRYGARRTELVVDLVVNADGSVSDAAVHDSRGSAIEESVLEAVRQWRFEPQPVARPYQVRLVVAPS